MNIKHLVLTFVLGVSLCQVAQANVTPANDDGAGNVVFFDRHQLNCGYQAIKSIHLFRPQYWQISFDYQCQEMGESSATDQYTPPNDDGGGNFVFLDRHGVDCANKGLQFLQLYRPSSTQIAYHYKCGTQALEDVHDYYTAASDDGAGNAIFLDRQYISCPSDEVLSYFRLERPSANTVRYHYRCGTPFIKKWQEWKMSGLCMDGSGIYPGSNVYLYYCHGENNQRWFLDANGLIHSRADQSLCIDTGSGSFGIYNAQMNYCDANDPGQIFSNAQGRVTAQFDSGEHCLSATTGSNNLMYIACTGVEYERFEMHSGMTRFDVDAFSYLNDILASSELQQFAAILQIDDFEVVNIDPAGTSTVKGKIRNMNNANPLGKAIELGVNLRQYLANDTRNDVPVILTVTNLGNGSYVAKVKLEIVRGWREISLNNPFGTQFKFKDADIVLTAKADPGQLTRTMGIEGTAYIKPTSLDNWLYVNPSIEKEIGEDPTTSYGLVINGACTSEPTEATDGNSQCTQNWDVMNGHVLTAYSLYNGGYNYLQADMVGGELVGGKVVMQQGQFLNTFNISGEWEGNSDGSKGKANVDLSGASQYIGSVINSTDFFNIYKYDVSRSYQIERVYITKDTTEAQTKIHVDMKVLDEEIQVIYSSQTGYADTAAANENLLRAIAEAIGRVIVNKNKTTLALLNRVIPSGLDVIGLRGDTTVYFNAAADTVNFAGTLVGESGELLQKAAQSFCGFFHLPC